MRSRNVLMLVGLLCSTACSSISGNSQAKNVTATVRFISIEGGFYALRGDDSVTYDPTNLPKAFQVDGLRVQSRLNVRSDLGGTHMVGPIVDIVEINTIRTL
jgi:hypothetical protein